MSVHRIAAATAALWAAVALGGTATAEAPAAESVSYQGYTVAATQAERVGNVVASGAYRSETRIYAGDGHWLVTVRLRFDASAPPSAAAGFIDQKRKAHVSREALVLYDPTAAATYLPSSWKGASWLDWNQEDEVLGFNKELTKAEKTYLFRVSADFDRKAAVLKIGDQPLKLSFKHQKWDKD